MKAGASVALAPSPIAAEAPPLAARLAGFVALTKPRITLLVLLTVAVGHVLGARKFGGAPAWSLLWTLLGSALVASGASAWNQFFERDLDRLMRRTAKRPLPAGLLSPLEALGFGTLLTVVGVGVLLVGANPLAAAVAIFTFISYVFIYTPLKTRTTLNTAVGAVPGALPPVIGWAGATGHLGIEAWALFLIVFLWQFPHFLAIAWLYRTDYDRAGFKMLPALDPDGSLTARHALSHALALLPVGLLPTPLGLAGGLYFVGALALSLFYILCAARFCVLLEDASARRLLRASFLHLPATLLLLVINPVAG